MAFVLPPRGNGKQGTKHAPPQQRPCLCSARGLFCALACGSASWRRSYVARYPGYLAKGSAQSAIAAPHSYQQRGEVVSVASTFICTDANT
eukprot:881637-Rhodomonas_salina.1